MAGGHIRRDLEASCLVQSFDDLQPLPRRDHLDVFDTAEQDTHSHHRQQLRETESNVMYPAKREHEVSVRTLWAAFECS